MSVLIGALAVALFNASKDPIARNFAYVYAVVSVGIMVCRFGPSRASSSFFHSFIRISIDPIHLPSRWPFRQVYGYALYQHRITMIRKRDPGHFGASSSLSLADTVGIPNFSFPDDRSNPRPCYHQCLSFLCPSGELCPPRYASFLA